MIIIFKCYGKKEEIKMTTIKMNLNLKKYNNIHLSSIINAPILKDHKVVGIITNYNINTDEATGYIYYDIIPSFDINMQNIISFVNL